MATQKQNISTESHEVRSVTRIILEKAQFGAVPIRFKLRNELIEDADDWHPVNWQFHPRLGAIQFTDGSVIHVTDVEEQELNRVYDDLTSQQTAEAVTESLSEFRENGEDMFESGIKSISSLTSGYKKGESD